MTIKNCKEFSCHQSKFRGGLSEHAATTPKMIGSHRELDVLFMTHATIKRGSRNKESQQQTQLRPHEDSAPGGCGSTEGYSGTFLACLCKARWTGTDRHTSWPPHQTDGQLISRPISVVPHGVLGLSHSWALHISHLSHSVSSTTYYCVVKNATTTLSACRRFSHSFYSSWKKTKWEVLGSIWTNLVRLLR